MTSAARTRRLRWLFACALAGVIIAAGFTAFAPGFVRLAVLQPARDLVFFQRELEPLQHYAEIERHRPAPDDTETLHAASSAGSDVDLVLDIWVPDTTPAPAVLLLHGSSPRGRALGFNMLLAERLRQAGWLVFTPDARGFGQSGSPQDPRDPAAWSVTGDLARLVAYALQHPLGNGVIVAVGHSLGGSHLLQLDETVSRISALVLIGPSRDAAEDERTWWRRVRFSTDRRLARAIPQDVVVAAGEWSDLLRFAANRPAYFHGRPILLLDGEREGESRIRVLRDAATLMAPDATHVTVPGAHHYCSAYQLPWPLQTVYLRPAVFERCFEPVARFLAAATEGAR